MLTAVRPKSVQLAALLLSAVFASCCASRSAHPKSAPVVDVAKGYIDLRPGWRVRVVTPILKSGAYKIEALEEHSGNDITLSTGGDFIGYETSFYAVMGQEDSGIHMNFISAEAFKNGKVFRESEPLVRLFNLPSDTGYVRLLLLVRYSEADHNVAIVAAKDRQTLDATTSKVQFNPDLCAKQTEAVCYWVPEGIAVRLEMQQKGRWVPVL